ncbi:hypothetical protein RAS1_03740 [Phycisphaerae bacterium RAS1]|nr:hypothetical protein RAS1_03740 [Phycisphaerae bacterium RAS1]
MCQSGPDIPLRRRRPTGPVQRRPRQRPARVQAAPTTGTVLDWFMHDLIDQGAAAGAAAVAAERIFVLPELDLATLIAEGPTAATSWEGYHAGKHGVWERFQNMHGQRVNLGELYFNDEWRWIRQEWKSADGRQLRIINQAQFRATVDSVFSRLGAPQMSQQALLDVQATGMRHIFDSARFTQDVGQIYNQFGRGTSATIWQGKYVRILPSGGVDIGPLQTNIDFTAHGKSFRIAVNAQTGQIINFFEIINNPRFRPMPFQDIVVKWRGGVTNPEVHRVTLPNGTRGNFTVEVSATWRGLITQGIKQGVRGSALVGGFLGAISGFRREGIPGALKGFAIGAVFAAGTGALIGGSLALAQRILPRAAAVAVRVLGYVSFVTTVFSILLDASETGLDPQEFGDPETGPDGNTYRRRHARNVGSQLFPDWVYLGLRIECPDGTVFEFGEDELGHESAFGRTPINVFARDRRIDWQMTRFPDGSSMWWWLDRQSQDEHILVFRDDTDMQAALDNEQERAVRFNIVEPHP